MNMVIYFVMMLMLKWWLKKQKWGGGCSCVSDDGKQPKAKIRIERALWLSWSFYLLKAIISWLSPSLLTISFPQFLQGKGKYQGRWRWPDCCTVLFLERHCRFWCQWCSCWRWWQCWWCLRCWRQWYILLFLHTRPTHDTPASHVSTCASIMSRALKQFFCWF